MSRSDLVWPAGDGLNRRLRVWGKDYRLQGDLIDWPFMGDPHGRFIWRVKDGLA